MNNEIDTSNSLLRTLQSQFSNIADDTIDYLSKICESGTSKQFKDSIQQLAELQPLFRLLYPLIPSINVEMYTYSFACTAIQNGNLDVLGNIEIIMSSKLSSAEIDSLLIFQIKHNYYKCIDFF